MPSGRGIVSSGGASSAGGAGAPVTVSLSGPAPRPALASVGTGVAGEAAGALGDLFRVINQVLAVRATGQAVVIASGRASTVPAPPGFTRVGIFNVANPAAQARLFEQQQAQSAAPQPALAGPQLAEGTVAPGAGVASPDPSSLVPISRGGAGAPTSRPPATSPRPIVHLPG